MNDKRARSQETDHQTAERRTSNAATTARARSKETTHETTVRLASNVATTARTRSRETPRQTATRQAADATAAATHRSQQSDEQHHEYLTASRQRAHGGRHPTPAIWEYAALRYDPQVDYVARPSASIVSMNHICRFCKAYKYAMEAPGLCCSNGKVDLHDLQDIPEPLCSLLLGQAPDSTHFLNNIRAYNSAFQMTSFGHARQNTGGFMPTFKIQGQVYHNIGSLLPVEGSPHSFLQIYFMGDREAEVNRRAQVVPGTKVSLLRPLQDMLHANNHYVAEFKTALERLQIQDQHQSFRIVIRADRTPAHEHQRCYNRPENNEVAVLIAGHDEYTTSRDIVLETHDSNLKRINELHPWYDALQYPLLFPSAEDGYHINIHQVNPATHQPTAKKVSAIAFYAFRLMSRENSLNYLLRGRMLLNQYLVDMYAKVSLCLFQRGNNNNNNN